MFKEYIGIVILGLIIAVVSAIGFSSIGSPLSQKDIQLDTTRLNEFSQIKRGIESYFEKNKKLPTNLKTVAEDKTYSYDDLQLNDLETKTPYKYEVLSSTSYNLCTTFSVGSEVLRKQSNASYALNIYEDATRRTIEFKKGYDCITYNISPSLIKRATGTQTPSYDKMAKSALVDEPTCKDSGGTWNNSECVMNYCKDGDKTVTSADNSFFTFSGIGFGASSETNSAMSDRCFNGYVQEMLCKKKGKLSVPQYMNYYCPNGCKDGACIK